MGFSAHGQVAAYYDENYRTLHVSITTPVNEEFITEYEAVLNPIRAQITHSHWGSIITMHGEPLTPLDTFSITKKSMSNAVEQGVVASALIFNVNGGKLVYQEFWDNLYEGSGILHRYFDEDSAAQVWITHILEQCDRDTG